MTLSISTLHTCNASGTTYDRSHDSQLATIYPQRLIARCRECQQDVLLEVFKDDLVFAQHPVRALPKDHPAIIDLGYVKRPWNYGRVDVTDLASLKIVDKRIAPGS